MEVNVIENKCKSVHEEGGFVYAVIRAKSELGKRLTKENQPLRIRVGRKIADKCYIISHVQLSSNTASHFSFIRSFCDKNSIILLKGSYPLMSSLDLDEYLIAITDVAQEMADNTTQRLDSDSVRGRYKNDLKVLMSLLIESTILSDNKGESL